MYTVLLLFTINDHISPYTLIICKPLNIWEDNGSKMDLTDEHLKKAKNDVISLVHNIHVQNAYLSVYSRFLPIDAIIAIHKFTGVDICMESFHGRQKKKK